MDFLVLGRKKRVTINDAATCPLSCVAKEREERENNSKDSEGGERPGQTE